MPLEEDRHCEANPCANRRPLKDAPNGSLPMQLFLRRDSRPRQAEPVPRVGVSCVHKTTPICALTSMDAGSFGFRVALRPEVLDRDMTRITKIHLARKEAPKTEQQQLKTAHLRPLPNILKPRSQSRLFSLIGALTYICLSLLWHRLSITRSCGSYANDKDSKLPR